MDNSVTDTPLVQRDRQVIWHPYSSATQASTLYAVRSAHGSTLVLEDGTELVDGMASWWCVIHGYNHPILNKAINAQVEQVAHVMFGGLTHEPAVALAETLVELTPEGLNRVFFSDSGSVGVDIALKMALQYWMAKGKPEKTRFMALKRGYHGDTIGAMSVCDPETGMHHLFSGVLPSHIFINAPPLGFESDIDQAYLDHLTGLFEKHHQDTAAFILEPIVQGAGGMRFYAPSYLKHIRKLCDQFNILLIADEIATGFGRTGKLFACEHANISPDILCAGKSLTGGYLTLAATLCTDAISQTLCSGEPGVFMHGPTFMANPLACSVAIASIKLLLDSPWKERISKIEQSLIAGLKPLETLPQVEEVRVLGAIGVIEMIEPVDMATITPLFVKNGIWIRPFGKLIYTMPAYNMSPADLETLIKGISYVINALR